MFILKKALLSIILISFFSCGKEKTIQFAEETISVKNNEIVSVVIEKAKGNLEISKNINASIDSLICVTLHIGDPDGVSFKPLKESIANFNSEYKKFEEDFPNSAQKWEAQIDGEVMYQSSELISYTLSSYTNTGGAHGNSNITFLNFNSKTGKKIDNNDLFFSKGEFLNIAEKQFNNQVDNIADYYFEEDVFALPANIGFNEDGVILLYNTYEIAGYSTGITEFTIPIEDVSNYLKYY